MTSDTPEPQDPVRFSKPKSEPPILDLEAEQPASAAGASAAKAEEPKHDTLRIEKQPPRKWPWSGFLGGLVGGGIVALGVLSYAHLTDQASTNFLNIESALTNKADSTAIAALDKRIAEIEAALGDAKSAIASATKKSASPDAEMVKRVAKLEAAIQSLDASAPQAPSGADRRALRLALVLSLRDAIRNDLVATKEIAALETAGETSPAFAALKSGLASPLVPFDEIRAEIIAAAKSAQIDEPPASETIKTQTRISSFFSQLVTVRSAGSVVKASPAETSFAPILDAVDQDDARAALTALAALPDSEAEKFKSVGSELKRRLAVEAAIAQLLDTALDAITKGDAP